MQHARTQSRRKFLHGGAAAAVAAWMPRTAFAADPVKIGLILPMTGPFASTGRQTQAGVRLYMQKNGDTVAGRKIELIVKDDTGLAPETTKRIAHDLIAHEQVSIIADFAPFLQRAKDAKPDALFVFVPSGQGTAVLKQFAERGLKEAGISLIGPGAVLDDDILEAIGPAALGMITSHHYSAAHASPENKAYVAAFMEANNGMRPNFMSVGGYDGTHLIYEALKKTGGATEGEKVVEAMKGMAWTSPRGPMAIDPATRDVVQNVYIRKCELVDGKPYNVEFDKVENFKDPGV